MLIFFILCMFLGLFVGFVAGLFGIGGGIMIVSSMILLLPTVGVPEQSLMMMALGSSFATIIITSVASAYRHYKLNNVSWSITKFFIPAMMISIFLCGYFIDNLPYRWVKTIFSIIIVLVALRMLMTSKAISNRMIEQLSAFKTIVAGIIIGAISSLAGLGGGVFIVPFLNANGLDIRKSIGTSSFCGIFLAIAGSLGFMLSGLKVSGLPPYSLGYIYLPAVLAITLTSTITTKFGAKLANTLPVAKVKRLFAYLLFILAIFIVLK